MCATQISEKNKQKAIYLMLFLFFIYKYFYLKNKPATENHNPFVLRGKAIHLCLPSNEIMSGILLSSSLQNHPSSFRMYDKELSYKYYRFKIFCKDVFLSFPPTGAVQIPVTDGFSYMSRSDLLPPLQIGNRTGHTQDTVVSTCRKLEPRHGGT